MGSEPGLRLVIRVGTMILQTRTALSPGGVRVDPS